MKFVIVGKSRSSLHCSPRHNLRNSLKYEPSFMGNCETSAVYMIKRFELLIVHILATRCVNWRHLQFLKHSLPKMTRDAIVRLQYISWLLWVVIWFSSSLVHAPITVAARSKTWTVFARSNTGIVSSNTTGDLAVCMRLFCVYVVLCVGSGLATGWSPLQGVLPIVCTE
jgi:hypothetical protein